MKQYILENYNSKITFGEVAIFLAFNLVFLFTSFITVASWGYGSFDAFLSAMI